MRFGTEIFGGKRLQITLYRFPNSNFTRGQHAGNNCWLMLRKWPKLDVFQAWKTLIFDLFFQNWSTTVDFSWNLILETWKGLPEVVSPQIFRSQTSYSLRGVEKTTFSAPRYVLEITTFICRSIPNTMLFRVDFNAQNRFWIPMIIRTLYNRFNFVDS